MCLFLPVRRIRVILSVCISTHVCMHIYTFCSHVRLYVYIYPCVSVCMHDTSVRTSGCAYSHNLYMWLYEVKWEHAVGIQVAIPPTGQGCEVEIWGCFTDLVLQGLDTGQVDQSLGDSWRAVEQFKVAAFQAALQASTKKETFTTELDAFGTSRIHPSTTLYVHKRTHELALLWYIVRP